MTYCFFNKNNSIDIQAMRDQISLIKQLGSHGIACLGLATEVNKLNFSEKNFASVDPINPHPTITISYNLQQNLDSHLKIFDKMMLIKL